MLTVLGRPRRCCEGLCRRELLQAGALLVFLASLRAAPPGGGDNQAFEREFHKPVLRYVHADLPTDETQPSVKSVGYLHPVYTPGGEQVTDVAPRDHPYLRGIFCAWSDVQGQGARGAFWDRGASGHRKGGVITNDWFRMLPGKPRPADPWAVAWVARNRWLVRDTEILREVLTARAVQRGGPRGQLEPTEPAPTEWQAYVIDLRYEFVNPLPIERRTGVIRLGANPFGGLCYRARPRGQPEITGPDGKMLTLPDAVDVPDGPARNWPAAAWYDLTYRSKDGKKVSGVAVLDHPTNPKASWYNHRGLHLLNPCIVAEGPVVIREPLVLRYRLVVHDGDAASVPLRKLFEEFASQK